MNPRLRFVLLSLPMSGDTAIADGVLVAPAQGNEPLEAN